MIGQAVPTPAPDPNMGEVVVKKVVRPKLNITLPKPKVAKVVVDNNAPTVLNDDEWYVVESEGPLYVVASPIKSLNILNSPGPMTLGGKFVGGSGTDEVKIYKGPHVTVIRKAKDAAGDVDLAFIPFGFKDETEVVRIKLTLSGPRPPPIIVDPVIVDPPVVDPVVVVPTGFRVIIAYESQGAPLPRELDVIINSTKIRAYLESKCAKSPEGVAEYRVWDDDVTTTATESATIRDMWATAQPKIGDVPRIIVAVNGKLDIYPMPANEAAVLAFLKKIGGE